VLGSFAAVRLGPDGRATMVNASFFGELSVPAHARVPFGFLTPRSASRSRVPWHRNV